VENVHISNTYILSLPGSLVLDIMAANGDQNPPRLQRVFWAGVEGAAATALLIAGGKEALSAVQVSTDYFKSFA
jgi:choline/glycine/proline betaine transport protein